MMQILSRLLIFDIIKAFSLLSLKKKKFPNFVTTTLKSDKFEALNSSPLIYTHYTYTPKKSWQQQARLCQNVA